MKFLKRRIGNLQRGILVSELLRDLKSSLLLKVVAGEDGLYRCIGNPRIQKPGLALAGFLEHIHPDRVQVFGETEMSYLRHIGDEKAAKRVADFFSLGIACVVVTKGIEIPSYMIEAADEHAVPLFASPKVSSECIDRLTDYLEDRLSPEQSVHGVLVDVFGVGVLIVGESGVGKSECALELVHRGHRLVADDMVLVKRKRGILWGTAPAQIQHLVEVRGLGIVNMKDLFGVSSIRQKKRVDIIVELVHLERFDGVERISFAQRYKELLGVKIPYVSLPVSPGRNITMLVEVAAKLFLLRESGKLSESVNHLIMGYEADGRGVE